MAGSSVAPGERGENETPKDQKAENKTTAPSSKTSQAGTKLQILKMDIDWVKVVAALSGALALFLSYWQINVSQQNERETERAFVFPSAVIFSIAPDSGATKASLRSAKGSNTLNIEARIKWKNSGSTPTENLEIYSKFSLFLTPPSFKITRYVLPDYVLLGPGAEVSSTSHLLSFNDNAFDLVCSPADDAGMCINNAGIAIAQAPRFKTNYLIFHGWAIYDDVFHVAHITHFCVYLPPDQLTSEHSFKPGDHLVGLYCRYGNCADDECSASGVMSPTF